MSLSCQHYPVREGVYWTAISSGLLEQLVHDDSGAPGGRRASWWCINKSRAPNHVHILLPSFASWYTSRIDAYGDRDRYQRNTVYRVHHANMLLTLFCIAQLPSRSQPHIERRPGYTQGKSNGAQLCWSVLHQSTVLPRAPIHPCVGGRMQPLSPNSMRRSRQPIWTRNVIHHQVGRQ
jgi:hypothetical protein